MLKRFYRPLQCRSHLIPDDIELLDLGGADQREEHAELCALEHLQQSTEDVIVIEEVLARVISVAVERLLQLEEHLVEHAYQRRARCRWRDVCDPVDDLQPLLNVLLHVQRSEYRADCVFADDRVRAVTKPLSNSEHVARADLTFA